MVKLQKYLFDTDFGAPRLTVVDMAAQEAEDEAEILPDEPPPPSFSEEDLALVREQAFAAGHAAGLQEAAASLEQMLGMATASCAHHLQSLGAAQTAANQAMEAHAVLIAMAVVRKLLPEYSRRYGVQEIEAAVKDSLSHLDQVTKITLRVHPDLVEAMRDKADRLIAEAQFDGKLLVAGDRTLGPGDCRLDWGDGGCERNEAQSWAEIDRVVEATLGKMQASAPEVME